MQRVARRVRATAVGLILAIGLSACASDGSPGAVVAPGPSDDGTIDARISLDDLCRARFGTIEPVEDVLVGLMTDSGSVDDGTFNQSAYEGVLAGHRCFGFDTTYVATGSVDDYALHLETLIDQGTDVVVTVGFLMADVTRAAAVAHPDVTFIGIDQDATPPLGNYAGLTFRDDQAGFLAGVAAGLQSPTGRLAVVGGIESVPAVADMVAGFERGARHVAPDVEIHRTFLDSFSDPAAGAAAAGVALAWGADTLYAPAGLSGSGALLAAAEQGAWVVGVDQDQYYTTFAGGVVPGADRLITSSLKRVDVGVLLKLAEYAASAFEGGPTVLDAAQGAITYAEPHDADVTPAALTRLETVRAGLVTGRIDAADGPGPAVRAATTAATGDPGDPA